MSRGREASDPDEDALDAGGPKHIDVQGQGLWKGRGTFKVVVGLEMWHRWDNAKP